MSEHIFLVIATVPIISGVANTRETTHVKVVTIPREICTYTGRRATVTSKTIGMSRDFDGNPTEIRGVIWEAEWLRYAVALLTFKITPIN